MGQSIESLYCCDSRLGCICAWSRVVFTSVDCPIHPLSLGRHLKSPVSWHRRPGSVERDRIFGLGFFHRGALGSRIVERRRSSRLSPSLPSLIPDLEIVLENGLSSIVEAVESIEAEDGAGESSEMTATLSEEVGDCLRGEEADLLGSPLLQDLSLISEPLLSPLLSPFSGSPLLSPEAADGFCQEAIDAGDYASVSSLSSLLPSFLVTDVRAAYGVGDSVGYDASTVKGVLPYPVAS
ncbi:hypothetical protein Dimus_029179 [Dionaea muscipula]